MLKHVFRFVACRRDPNTNIFQIRVFVSLAVSSCRYVLRPSPGFGQGLCEPRSASNAKSASSNPQKQGPKKQSKHGGHEDLNSSNQTWNAQREGSEKVCVDIHVKTFAGSSVILR